MVIDAHLHLWDKQLGRVGENKVVALKDGKSDFGGEIRQMMPPYMLDGRNTVEMLISNMNYARVSGCVVTQEYIDGNQDHYLLECRKKYPKRIKVCCLYEEKEIKVIFRNCHTFLQWILPGTVPQTLGSALPHMRSLSWLLLPETN